MAKVRIGFSTQFELENELVGIGTDNPTQTLQALGNIRSSNAQAVGLSTFTTFDGFVDTKAAIAGAGGAKSGSISGEIIIDGNISVSTGTTFTSGLENLTATDNFTLPGISEDDPSVGTTRFNENLGALEFYTGNEWRAVNSYIDMGNRGRGLNMAGYAAAAVKTIDYITIPTLGNSKNFGDMTAAFYLNSAFASRTRGISGGAYPAPGTSIYEYVTIASEGNSISFGNLATNGKYGRGAVSSSTRGILGGYYNQDATMEYIEIDTLGNGADFGDLTVGRSYSAGMNSPTRGVFAGGFQTSPGSQTFNTIDYVTIANKGNAADFGDLIANGVPYDGALSSSTRGVITAMMVYSPGTFHDNRTMNYITIASTGNATEFGDTNGNHNIAVATSTQIRGVFMGGLGRTSPNPVVSNIEYITIATTGNSVDFGNLSTPKYYGGGTSDSHGGLGGF